MPTYQYACTECGEQLEVVQKFSDDPLTVCPACQGRLRKVFSAVGVVFKGSGFYKTDSRAKTSTSTAAGTGAKSDSNSEPKTDTKTESTPGSTSGSTPGSKSGGDSKPAGTSGGDGTKVA